MKEKLEPLGEPASLALAGLGMMRKDAEGWVFAYFEQGELYEGRSELELCAECHETGRVPEDLADLFGLGDLSELRYVPPRDSVFLTLPAPSP